MTTSQRKLVQTSLIPIRWGDMDAYGHVNNTIYFRYMEQAASSFSNTRLQGHAAWHGTGDHQRQLHLPDAAQLPGCRRSANVLRLIPAAAACRRITKSACRETIPCTRPAIPRSSGWMWRPASRCRFPTSSCALFCLPRRGGGEMDPAALWRPSAERIAAARLSAFMAAVNRRWQAACGLRQPLALVGGRSRRRSGRSLWDECGVLGERGDASLEDGDRMPGARWFPQARLNYAREPAAPRRSDHADALVFWGEDKVRRRLSNAELYAQVSRCAQACRRRRRPGRSRRRLPAEPARGLDRHAGHGFARRHLVVGIARLRGPGRARPFRADRTQGPALRRWLLVQRQAGRLHGQERRSRRADAKRGADVVVSYLDDSPACPHAQWRALRRLRRAVCRRRDRVRAAAFRAPAVHHVFLGHHRRSQVHRALSRRRLLQHLKEHQLHGDLKPATASSTSPPAAG
jgi:hypothetical protein